MSKQGFRSAIRKHFSRKKAGGPTSTPTNVTSGQQPSTAWNFDGRAESSKLESRHTSRSEAQHSQQPSFGNETSNSIERRSPERTDRGVEATAVQDSAQRSTRNASLQRTDSTKAKDGPTKTDPLTAPREKGEQSQEESVSFRLWNEAYDELESNDTTAKLTSEYNIRMAGWLEDKELEHLDHSARETRRAQIEHRILSDFRSPQSRQTRVAQLVKYTKDGQEKTKNASERMDRVAGVANAVLWAKPVADIILQVPQAAPAALPWAGVCLGMQILANPSNSRKSNLDGIAYVNSKMEWYDGLCQLILKANDALHTSEWQQTQKQLRTKLLDLYKEILTYQMKSACVYYQSQRIVFLRDLGFSNDWDAHLKSVTDAEEALDEGLTQTHRLHMEGALDELRESAKAQTYELQAMHRDIQQAFKDQNLILNTIRTEKADQERLKDLYALIDPYSHMKSIESKRGLLLRDVYQWILDTKQYGSFIKTQSDASNPLKRVLWLKGGAGTGKTMLLVGIIRDLSEGVQGHAPKLCYFFCDSTNNRTCKSATAIVRSFIWMLLLQQPKLMEHVRSVYSSKLDTSIFTDSEDAWWPATEMLNAMLVNAGPVFLVVDALDECEDTTGLDRLLDFVAASLTDRTMGHVKWLISSRREVNVLRLLKTKIHRTSKERPDRTVTLDMEFEELDLQKQRAESSVDTFIQHKISGLKGRPGYTEHILEQVSDHIRKNNGGIFLWVSLVFAELDVKDDNLEQLNGFHALDTVKKMPNDLIGLYDLILKRIEKNSRERRYSKTLLTAVALARRSLSIAELAEITNLGPVQPSDMRVQDVVSSCGSFLFVTNDDYVTPIHQSAKEYLEKALKEQDIRFESTTSETQQAIVERSLAAMAGLYKGRIRTGRGSLSTERLSRLHYSISSWPHHFNSFINSSTESQTIDHLFESVFDLLKAYFLDWFESLSIINDIVEGITTLKGALGTIRLHHSTKAEFVKFLTDAVKFMSDNRTIVQHSPRQVYHEALAFTSPDSEIRKLFWKDRLPLIKSCWTSQTAKSSVRNLRCPGTVKSTFSKDGTKLALATRDEKTQIWDVEAAYPQQLLESIPQRSNAKNALDQIKALAFSVDGQKIAIGSEHGFLAVDNIETGSRQVLHSLVQCITAVAISADAKMLAALNGQSGALELWNLETPAKQVLLHDIWVDSLIFLGDGTLASTCKSPKGICFWDGTTGVLERQLPTTHHCGCLTVSCGDMMSLAWATMGVYKSNIFFAETSETSSHFIGKVTGVLQALAFSADNKLIASLFTISGKMEVVLWNVETGSQAGSLALGLERQPMQMSFMPDEYKLALASRDVFRHGGNVKLEVLETGLAHRTLLARATHVTCVALSGDGEKLAAGSLDGGLQLWTAQTGVLLKTFAGHKGRVASVVFSAGGKILASGGGDHKVRLWYLGSEDCTVLEGHETQVQSLAFSDDGTRLASGDFRGNFCLWRVQSSQCDSILMNASTGCNGIVRSIIFSDDSKYFAVNVFFSFVRLCSSTSGEPLRDISLDWDIGPLTGLSGSKNLAILRHRYGAVHIKGPANEMTPHPPDPMCAIEGEWDVSGDCILKGNKELLKFPPGLNVSRDYGQPVWDIHGHTIAIGHESGAVTVVHFDLGVGSNDHIFDVESEEEYRRRNKLRPYLLGRHKE